MNIHRITALMYRYSMLLRHDLGKILDTLYWPLIDIFSWGFLTIYLSRSQLFLNNFATTLLSAIILWTFVYQIARDVAVSFLDDLWDRNVLNLYGSPLRPGEFLVASFMIALLRVIITFTVLSVIAYFGYGFNIMSLGVYLGLFILVLVIFSYTIGIIATTMILRFGQSVEIFAWSVPAILSPVSAVFYPVSVLPEFVQRISYLFPTTYVFEGMRAILLQGEFIWQYIVVAFILDAFYLAAVIIMFFGVFHYVRKTGLIGRFS